MSKGSFGDCLKRERKMREVSLEEVCAATRIGTRFLQAMENEDWEKLPGGVFNRGFIRAVARYLGLDEETMLAEYDLAHAKHSQPTSQPPGESMPRPFPPWLLFALLLAAAALVLGGFYAWRHFAHRRAAPDITSAVASETSAALLSASPAKPPALSTEAALSQSATSDSPLLTPPRLDLSLSARRATRVLALGDTKRLFDGIVNAGETRRFQARDEFSLSAGDPGAVLLELNGQTMPPLASSGFPGKMSLTRKS